MADKKGMLLVIPYLRRTKILDFISARDVVYLQELSDELGISVSTIRRDLITLEKDGEIIQLRGGAAKLNRRDHDEPVQRKKLVQKESKEIIAKKAAALVEDGDVIYIDSGTTTTAMFQYLKDKHITVVTSSLQVAENMPIKNSTCIFLGGELLPDLESVVGSITEKIIATMYFDKAFIGGNGYARDGGVYTFDIREARKKELVKEHSNQVYFLADSTKENKRAFCRVFDFNECILISEKDDPPAEDHK